jgi:hypothetical protein
MGAGVRVSALRPSSLPGLAQGCPASSGQTLRIHPDRLVRVLAEGLRTIEERRAREQTESANRAIIVAPKTEEPSDEPAPEP